MATSLSVVFFNIYENACQPQVSGLYELRLYHQSKLRMLRPIGIYDTGDHPPVKPKRAPRLTCFMAALDVQNVEKQDGVQVTGILGPLGFSGVSSISILLGWSYFRSPFRVHRTLQPPSREIKRFIKVTSSLPNLAYVLDVWFDHRERYEQEFGDDAERIERRMSREPLKLPPGSTPVSPLSPPTADNRARNPRWLAGLRHAALAATGA